MAGTVSHRTALEAVLSALRLTAFPSALMLGASLLVYVITVPPRLAAALQHLAAGIVLSAVSVELIPIIAGSPNDASSIVGIVLGFTLGIGFFLLFGMVCETGHAGEEEGNHDAAEGSGGTEDGDEELHVSIVARDTQVPRYRTKTILPGGEVAGGGGRSKVNQMVRAQVVADEMRRAAGAAGVGPIRLQRATSEPHVSRGEVAASVELGRTLMSAERTHSDDSGAAGVVARGERVPLPAAVAPPMFPFQLMAAVSVDAMVDGLLIGISSAAGEDANAGIVMTIALSIEMTFLGLTFATIMARQARCISIPCIIVPPLVLLGGGCAGALVATFLKQFPPVHLALISFGVAALLYLVTEELLLEAHESTGDHVWWIDLMFFVGFLAAFLCDKLTA